MKLVSFRRQRSLYIAILAFFLPLICQGAPSDIPPIRSFLAVSESTALRLRQSLQLSREELPAGIYYTHVEEGRVRLDVNRASSRSAEFDAHYLAEDTALKTLYGSAAWAVRPLNRYVQADGQATPSATRFDDFRWEAKWITHARKDGQLARQLWVNSPTGLRWMLREENSVQKITRYFSEIPKHLVPVSNGALWVPKDGTLAIAFVNGKSFTKFPLLGLKNETTDDVTFQVATHAETGPWGDKTESPLVVYDEPSHQVLFAGWTVKPGDRRRLSLEDGESSGLFLLNIDTLEVVELWRGLKWPFHLANSGIFQSGTDAFQLFHRKMNWDKITIGPRIEVPLPSKFRVEMGAQEVTIRDLQKPSGSAGSVFYISSEGNHREKVAQPHRKPTKEELYQIELLGYPPDLLGRVRTGEENVALEFADVNQKLNQVLGGNKNTAVALIYEEYDAPRAVLSSFLWNAENSTQPISQAVRSLEHVYSLQPSHFDFLSQRSPHAVGFSDAVSRLHQNTLDNGTLVFFRGFPTSVQPEGIASFETIHKRFLSSIEQGRVRVVFAIPRASWGQLKAKYPSLVSSITPVVLGGLSDADSRRSKTRILMDQASLKEDLPFTESALRKVLDISESLRSEIQERGESDFSFLNKLVEDLFAYARTENIRSEMTDATVDKFQRARSKRYGHWKIQVFSDAQGAAPAWVSNWADRSPALSSQMLKRWQLKRDYLISSDSYSHALFNLPDGVEIDGSKLILLSPESDPEVLLKKVNVLFVRLHPDGFYTGTQEKDQFVLSFFKLGETNEDGKEAPGSWKVLTSDYSVKDFQSSDIQLRYLRGRLHVVSKDGERVFGPEGEEDPGVR